MPQLKAKSSTFSLCLSSKIMRHSKVTPWLESSTIFVFSVILDVRVVEIVLSIWRRQIFKQYATRIINQYFYHSKRGWLSFSDLHKTCEFWSAFCSLSNDFYSKKKNLPWEIFYMAPKSFQTRIPVWIWWSLIEHIFYKYFPSDLISDQSLEQIYIYICTEILRRRVKANWEIWRRKM